MPRDENRTVYSTETGDQRKQPAKPPAVSHVQTPPGQQTAYLHRDSKGRGGKVVSLVKNLVLPPDELKDLCTQIKQACGTGGTVKDGVIEIQGDHRPKIAQVLEKLGYKTKIAGG